MWGELNDQNFFFRDELIIEKKFTILNDETRSRTVHNLN